MNWETAKALLKMQGREPTERDRELVEQGFTSHILYPNDKPSGWGRETNMMGEAHVEEDE